MMYAAGPDGTRIASATGVLGACPLCGAPMVPKCGAILVHHWAHRVRADCDPWAERDSAWHRGWQEAVPPDRREVVMGPHRADLVAADGTVVELQRSAISPAEIGEREQFYKHMIWVFDAIEPVRSGRLDLR